MKNYQEQILNYYSNVINDDDHDGDVDDNIKQNYYYISKSKYF